jgi:hypothetical protein
MASVLFSEALKFHFTYHNLRLRWKLLNSLNKRYRRKIVLKLHMTESLFFEGTALST